MRILVAPFLLSLLLAAGLSAQTLAPREIAAKARPAVVLVQALEGGRVVGQGSGFLVSDDGRLVTNRHVIEGASSLRVQLATGEIYDRVFYVSDDERRDLAVLRIPATGTPKLQLRDDRAAEVGDAVYVMGNPMGLEGTFSHGLISARRTLDGVSLIQISAPISQGSSGGPVLNGSGEVIGVATLTLEEGQNLNLAVPARYAEGLLSVAEAPRPFEAVASRFAPASPAPAGIANASGRMGETADWVLSLAAEMTFVDSIMQMLDMAAVHDPHVDMLDEGEVATTEFDFDVGDGEVIVIGVCDEDCADLDLAVYDGRGRLIERDIQDDARPYVQFRVVASGVFTVKVAMEQCSTTTCGFAIQTYAPR
jgi:hypothetical protein